MNSQIKYLYSKVRIFILILPFTCFFHISFSQNRNYKWIESDTNLALISNTSTLWQLNFDKKKDKPYFHPLRTKKGYDLTLERPIDHPWHRGLWFSWKYINGTNYWEEDPKTGLAKGRSEIKNIKIKKKPNFSAAIKLDLIYFDEKGDNLSEKREINISSPELQINGYYIIMNHKFTALKDVVLDLEKPAINGGVSWGGYAGLGFRGSNSLQEITFLTSSGWSTKNDTTGYGSNERWMDLSAKANLNTNDEVGISILDHNKNAKSPSPWYIWYAAGQNIFFMPSPLFNGPISLKKGETLLLKYKVWIHDGKGINSEIEKQYNQFNNK